jgi:hypothetical protein
MPILARRPKKASEMMGRLGRRLSPGLGINCIYWLTLSIGFGGDAGDGLGSDQAQAERKPSQLGQSSRLSPFIERLNDDDNTSTWSGHILAREWNVARLLKLAGYTTFYAEMGHTRAVVTKRWKYIAFRVPPSREFTAEEKEIFADRLGRDKTGLTQKMGCRATHMQGSTPGYVPGAWQTHPDHFFDRDQLYDLENDPQELRNLARDPKHAGILADMKRKLREYCLGLPGTFAEFKTIDECPAALKELIAQAKIKPLIPISTKRRITDKMPKIIRK